MNNQWLQSALFPNAIFTIDEETIPNKNFDSKIEDVFVGKLTIREIELDTPFSITAYIQDEKLFVTGLQKLIQLGLGLMLLQNSMHGRF